MGNTMERDSDDQEEAEDDNRVLCRQGSGAMWTVSRFYDDEEDAFFTEFEHEYKDTGSMVCVERSVEMLRQIRHPNIIKYLSSTSESTKMYVLTESVVPIKRVLGWVPSVEAVMGIREVARALDFMHNRLRMLHNNLHLGAVFVCEKTSQWKIAGMEASCDMKKVDDKFLSSVSCVRESSAIPPEEKDPASSGMQKYPLSRDIWALGQLILTVDDELGEDNGLPTDLVEYAETNLTNEDPRERPTTEQFLLHPASRTDFTEVVEYLSDFTLKTEEDRALFCKKLLSIIMSFPEEAVCHRLLPVMLTPPVMGDPAMNPIWDSILIPKSDGEDGHQCGFFSEDCFKREIVPKIGELFHSRENHVRVILLKYFQFFVELFPLEDIEEVILPEVLVGLQEKDDELVASTLRALAILVTLLGSDVVMGTTRSSVFSDSRPKSAIEHISTATPPIKSFGDYISTKSHTMTQGSVTSLPTPSSLSKEEKRKNRREKQALLKQKRLQDKEKTLRIAMVKKVPADVELSDSGESPTLSVNKWESPASTPEDGTTHSTLHNDESQNNNDDGDGWEDFEDDWHQEDVWGGEEQTSKLEDFNGNGRDNSFNDFTRTISTSSVQSSSILESPGGNWDRVSLSSYTSGSLLKKTPKKDTKNESKSKKQQNFDLEPDYFSGMEPNL